jgi:hypothetical protein
VQDNNGIGDEGCKALGEALKGGPTDATSTWWSSSTDRQTVGPADSIQSLT